MPPKRSNVLLIRPTREAFEHLSRPMVLWATLSKVPVNAVYCSMAKGR